MLVRIILFFKRHLRFYIRKFFKFKYVRLNGIKINISDLSPSLKMFFYSDSYENYEIRLLEKYLNENDIVMELGTGIGFLSAFCAKKVGSKNVYSFEANPSNDKKN